MVSFNYTKNLSNNIKNTFFTNRQKWPTNDLQHFSWDYNHFLMIAKADTQCSKHKKQLAGNPRNHKTKVHMSFGLRGPLRTAFELTNWFAYVKQWARCGYTNATCPQLAKTIQKHRTSYLLFPKFTFYKFVCWGPHSLTISNWRSPSNRDGRVLFCRQGGETSREWAAD